MYISVLNSDLKKSPWLAIQWDPSLPALLGDTDYDPAVNQNFPKNKEDKTLSEKTVTDRITGATPTATVIQLAIKKTGNISLHSGFGTKKSVPKTAKRISGSPKPVRKTAKKNDTN